jgi:geranylgeranyl pyrophosphate synthase
MLHSAGSIDYARQRATAFIHQAAEDLSDLPPSQAKKLLQEIACLVV